MCLIAFAIGVHPGWPLVVLANRDEWLERPSAPAHWWTDRPECYGGRDLRASGSWMLTHTGGRLAMLTNDPRKARSPDQASRGDLVSALVADDAPLEDATARLLAGGQRFAGFQLVGFDWRDTRLPEAVWASNVDAVSPERLGPGVYTLTNAPLDTPWRKALHLGQALADGLFEAQDPPLQAWLQALATDTAHSPTDGHPHYAGSKQTGAGIPEPAGPLANPFVRSSGPDGYGTRVSTILRLDHEGRLYVDEWQWAAASTPPRWTHRRSSRFVSRRAGVPAGV